MLRNYDKRMNVGKKSKTLFAAVRFQLVVPTLQSRVAYPPGNTPMLPERGCSVILNIFTGAAQQI